MWWMRGVFTHEMSLSYGGNVSVAGCLLARPPFLLLIPLPQSYAKK